MLEWSFKRTKRVFFFPDQHLGRNTALKMGITNDQMPVFDPYEPRARRQHRGGDQAAAG